MLYREEYLWSNHRIIMHVIILLECLLITSIMNIIAWNCRGISSKIHELPILLKEGDIICLSETKLRPTSNSRPFIRGYNHIRQDRSVGEGSGLLVFFKNSITHSKINLRNIPVGIEVIEAQIKNGQDFIHLFSIYIPPQLNFIKAQLEHFI